MFLFSIQQDTIIEIQTEFNHTHVKVFIFECIFEIEKK